MRKPSATGRRRGRRRAAPRPDGPAVRPRAWPSRRRPGRARALPGLDHVEEAHGMGRLGRRKSDRKQRGAERLRQRGLSASALSALRLVASRACAPARISAAGGNRSISMSGASVTVWPICSRRARSSGLGLGAGDEHAHQARARGSRRPPVRAARAASSPRRAALAGGPSRSVSWQALPSGAGSCRGSAGDRLRARPGRQSGCGRSLPGAGTPARR